MTAELGAWAAAAPPAAGAVRGALRIENAVKYYGSGPSRVLALDGSSLDVSAGEICVVVGPSGCGKTTLLHAIAGFHGLDGGTIHLDGNLLCGGSRAETARPDSDRVVVFQNGALLPWKTNLENVMLGPRFQGRVPIDQVAARARRLMRDAGLEGYENAYPGETSSGVKRRVEIVRALMNDPAVLLLDEPFRALDSLTKSMMHAALLAIHAQNRSTIFFITHDLEEAVFLGSRVVVMTSRPGRVKKVIDVDIPYPRTYGVLTSRPFREYVRAATSIVHEEALRAYERGEQEGRAS
ncbi:MAG TPA: ABC transporter ATP-binding protein [Polyangiaceae bacterium]|jgi:NitT/TauT family transport system ATP-binding protein|nr:ABC transporter ATP-binding protein [Polyangiaceae bacterium]